MTVPASAASGSASALLRDAVPRLEAQLDALSRYRPALLAIAGGPPPAARWDQDWFPRLDAAIAYAMVRTLRPRRIVEIGAGHSTRFLARAVDDGALSTEIVAVDPAPRAPIAALPPVHHVARPLQTAADEIARLLPATDILFVDSSHVLAPGSDVAVVHARLLPALPAGAYLHLHDIFLPDDYPETWSRRGYNEQSLVAALLVAGGWQIEFASHFAATRLADAVARSPAAVLPLVEGAIESSLWLRKS